MLEQDIEVILTAGIAAPSADNSQPWQYEFDGRCLKLWIDKSRAGGISDARYVLSDLALGAVIESMRIQASALGYATEVSYFPDERQEFHVATLSWTVAEPHDLQLAGAILQRHTDRRFPWQGPVKQELKQAMIDQASMFPHTGLLWLDAPEQRRAGLALLRRAEALRFRTQALHQELFSSIHFDIGWQEIAPEGLSPATLAVEAPMRPLFSSLRHWSLIRALSALGADKMLGFRSAALPACLSPGLGILTTRAINRVGIIDSGRALQRMWLQATLQGLSFQPYAAAGIYSLGFIALSEKEQRSLQSLKERMTAICGEQHGLLFFRVGLAPTPPPPKSGRRPFEQFLKP